MSDGRMMVCRHSFGGGTVCTNCGGDVFEMLRKMELGHEVLGGALHQDEATIEMLSTANTILREKARERIDLAVFVRRLAAAAPPCPQKREALRYLEEHGLFDVLRGGQDPAGAIAE